MVTVKSQFVQLTSAAIMLFIIFGLLSMVWPGILALFLGILLLLHSWSSGQETAVLPWSEVDNLWIVFASLR